MNLSLTCQYIVQVQFEDRTCINYVNYDILTELYFKVSANG